MLVAYDISTTDALTTISVFILALLLTSLSIQGLRDLNVTGFMGRVYICICSGLATACWSGFTAVFTIDQQYGSFMVLGYIWFVFAITFLVMTVGFCVSLWNFRQGQQEFTIR
jgi:hypothetical protein